MTNRQFMHALRQYAHFAERKRRSYAAMVKALRDLYTNERLEGIEEPADRAKEMERVENIVQQVYAPIDPLYYP